jgi:hypothetical protein
MSQRLHELSERQTALQLRCASQRLAVAREVYAIEVRLRAVDRVAAVARRVVQNRVVIAAGLIALFAVGRLRALRVLGRGLVLVTTASRLVRAAKRL